MKPALMHRIVLVAAGFLCALLFLPAISSSTGGHALSDIAFAAFHRVCHQDPARGFHLMGAALPLCARCTGLVLGFFAGWAALPLIPSHRRNRPVSNPALAVFFVPLAVDGTLNLLGLFSTPAPMRFLTGILFAAGAARALWPALTEALTGFAPGKTRAAMER